jgi:hypothetical protein
MNVAYQISAILDQMPSGRVRRPKVDKYAEHKQLLEQVPEGKVAQIPKVKQKNRAFSAGIRAAGVQVNKKVDCSFRHDAAYINWSPLTEANRPKRRGGRRRSTASAAR